MDTIFEVPPGRHNGPTASGESESWATTSTSEPQSEELNLLQSRHYQRMEAPLTDLQEFFQSASPQLVSSTLEYNEMDLLMAQRALLTLLKGWQVVRECRYDYRMPAMVKRHAVEVAPNQYDYVVEFGRQFWQSPEGKRLVLDYYVEPSRREEDSELSFVLPVADHAWLNTLLPEMRRIMDEQHFLHNQAFTAKGEFLRFDEVVAWEDVILPSNVRQALKTQCVDLIAYAGLFRANGIPLKRGILLHGKPGTGKTMIGKALARNCGVTFILTTPGMLEEPKDVRRVFQWGCRFAPSILFFEDFDLVAGSRHGAARREILGEFLSSLDGVGSTNGVIVIATTNDLHAIEPAIKDRPNRFDLVLEIPPMAKPECVAFLEAWKAKRPSEFDVEAVAGRATGYTGAQLQELCRQAIFEAVNSCVAAGQTEAVMLPVSDAHFEAAFSRMKVRRKRRAGFLAEQQ